MTIYHVVPVVTVATAFAYANRELAEAAIEELIQNLRVNGNDLYSGTGTLIGQIDGFMCEQNWPLSEAGYLSRASEAKLEMKKKHDLDFIDPFLMMGIEGMIYAEYSDEEMLNHFRRILKEDYRQKHRKALLAELKEEMKPSRTLGAVVDALAKDAKKRVVSIRKKAKARKFRSLGKRGGIGSN